MPTTTRSPITVELEAGADPIRGSIARSDGGRQPLWGWVELMEELRRIAAATPAAGNRAAGKPHGGDAIGGVEWATGRRKKARQCDAS